MLYSSDTNLPSYAQSQGGTPKDMGMFMKTITKHHSAAGWVYAISLYHCPISANAAKLHSSNDKLFIVVNTELKIIISIFVQTAAACNAV